MIAGVLGYIKSAFVMLLLYAYGTTFLFRKSHKKYTPLAILIVFAFFLRTRSLQWLAASLLIVAFLQAVKALPKNRERIGLLSTKEKTALKVTPQGYVTFPMDFDNDNFTSI